MALVVGHSQTKYLSDYLCEEKYSVFSYPGYRSLKFLTEDVLFDVIPSSTETSEVIVVVTGANDIGAKTPEKIADDVVYLCNEIHNTSPSVTVMVSTVLPRCQNKFEIEIENYCVCNLPECVDTVMVQCDKCANWFHKSCINAPSDISTSDQDFTCGFC